MDYVNLCDQHVKSTAGVVELIRELFDVAEQLRCAVTSEMSAPLFWERAGRTFRTVEISPLFVSEAMDDPVPQPSEFEMLKSIKNDFSMKIWICITLKPDCAHFPGLYRIPFKITRNSPEGDFCFSQMQRAAGEEFDQVLWSKSNIEDAAVALVGQLGRHLKGREETSIVSELI